MNTGNERERRESKKEERGGGRERVGKATDGRQRESQEGRVRKERERMSTTIMSISTKTTILMMRIS